MKCDVLCIGGAVFDVFVQAENERVLRIASPGYFEEFLAFPLGEKIDIGQMHSAFGGGAANVAVGLAILGLRTCVWSAVGDDYYAREIVRNLKKHKVDTQWIRTIADTQSDFSLVLNSFDGERTILCSRTAGQALDATHLRDAIWGKKWIHITSIAGKAQDIFDTLRAVKQQGKTPGISWNPGLPQLKHGLRKLAPFLRSVDTLFVNKEELEMLAGIQTKRYNAAIQQYILTECRQCLDVQKNDKAFFVYDIRDAAKKLLKLGVKSVVVTDGKRGAQYMNGSNHWYVPCGEAKPVSTLGAGDAFCSGFLGSYAARKDPAEALAFGTANASSVVSQFGAQHGLLAPDELKQKSISLPVISLLK